MMDVQSTADARQVRIQKVGVKGIKHPLRWQVSAVVSMQTVGVFDLFVELEPEKKGTHMSRFLDVLYRHAVVLDVERLKLLVSEIRDVLEAPAAFVTLNFSYFFQKAAPVSGKLGLFDVDVRYEVSTDQHKKTQVNCAIQVPVQSLCPCSKSISEYGAHNQRSVIQILVKDSDIAVDALIAIAEQAASSALYPVLKRIDEKHVTERAFENPKFVEDLVRDAAVALRQHTLVKDFEVTAENFESIHSHNVWAWVSSQKS